MDSHCVSDIIRDLKDRAKGQRWSFWGLMTGDYKLKTMVDCCIPALRLEECNNFLNLIEMILEDARGDDSPFSIPWWRNVSDEEPSRIELLLKEPDRTIPDDWL